MHNSDATLARALPGTGTSARSRMASAAGPEDELAGGGWVACHLLLLGRLAPPRGPRTRFSPSAMSIRRLAAGKLELAGSNRGLTHGSLPDVLAFLISFSGANT